MTDRLPALEPAVVAPLLRALRNEERAVRRAVLRALVRLPLSATDWIGVGGYIRHALTVLPQDPEPSYAVDRADLIDAAAFVPTRGARDRLLEIASDGVPAEQRAAAAALVQARDPRITPLLLARLAEAPAGDDAWILDALTACDLSQAEDMLPALRTLAQRHPSPDVRFWLSVALAKAGHAAPFVNILREIAEGGTTPEFLHGSPFRVTEELARRAPYPDPVRNIFRRVAEDPSHPMRNISGDLLEQLQAPYVHYTRQPAPEAEDIGATRVRAAAAADQAERDFQASPAPLDVDALRFLAPTRATAVVTSLFTLLAARAAELPPGGSNDVAELVHALGAGYTPDPGGLFPAFVAARAKSHDLPRHIAWAASRDGLDGVLNALAGDLAGDRAAAAAEFIELAAGMVDLFHPPYFGAGPVISDLRPTQGAVADLIDDAPRESMMANGPPRDTPPSGVRGGERGRRAKPPGPTAPPPDAPASEPDVLLYSPSPRSPSHHRVRSERVVNTGFCPHDSGDPDDELTSNDALRTGGRYRFWIDVDVPRATSIESAPAPLPTEHLPQTARLVVAVYAFPGEITITSGQDVGAWQLQADGSVTVLQQPAPVPRGTAAETAAIRLYFPVRAPRQEGTYRLRCNIYHENMLLQSRLIEATILERPRVIGGALRSTVDYTIGKALDPVRLAAEPPHRLSLMLNDNGDGTHGFRLFGGDQNDVFKNDATLDGGQLGKLVQQARGALRLAAWGDEDEWTGGKAYRYAAAFDIERVRGDLARMAIRGRRFYTAVISALSGGRPKADALAKLMRTPGVVQLANKQSARHVVPLALFYDYTLDTNAADLSEYELCSAFLETAQSRAPLEEGPCLQGHCPVAADSSNKTTICPSGFWGFRHAIGLPLTVPSAPDPPAALYYRGHPEFAVGVATDPAFTLRPEHEAKLQALSPNPVWKYADTRDEVLDLLRGAEPHVVYLYCHGGVRNGVPYLAVGHNEPVITPDNVFDGVYWGEGTRPIVFINGCHTTALEPETALEFVTAFVDNAAAAGVIGTEITIFEPLARAFAEDCLGRFLAGQSIGESVRRARLALLKDGNPLGLVYIPFVTPGLRLLEQET